MELSPPWSPRAAPSAPSRGCRSQWQAVISRGSMAAMPEYEAWPLPAKVPMPRPIQARIHSSALQANLRRVRQSVPDAKVWAVVKANAYGHGIARVFESLRGADGFALLDLAEAQGLRGVVGVGGGAVGGGWGWGGGGGRAARSCCSKACSSRAIWNCARAWGCGMSCTATSRSTCWPRTGARRRSMSF